MKNLISREESRSSSRLHRLSIAGLVAFLLLAVAACEQPEGEPAPSGVDDVDDISLPSDNLGDDDDAPGDDDDAAGDDDDAVGDDDDAVGDDDDAPGDDDDDDDDPDPEPTTPVTYDISDADSLLYVQVFKDPSAVFAAFAHDHVMRATNWTGTFEYDPADLSSCTFELTIDVDDLLVDENAMRSLVGYGDTINSGDRTTIRNNMLAADQLNAAVHPQISVVSQSCGAGTGAGTTDGILAVTADMTLRGVTVAKSVDLDITLQNGDAYIQGDFGLTATEFGFSPYQNLGGAVRNLDGMSISFDMVGFPSN